jgi:transcriptional regulator with XRE-family HTH domain
MTPAAVLRDARLKAGLTQTELARRLDSSQAAVARLESPGANPTFRTLRRVLQATGHELELDAIPRSSSIDETLIASNLRLSPAERLRRFQSWHRSMRKLAAAARRSRGRTS